MKGYILYHENNANWFGSDAHKNHQKALSSGLGNLPFRSSKLYD